MWRESETLTRIMIIKLNPFTRLFMDRSFEWLNDPEIRRLTDTPPVTREGQEKWFKSLNEKKDYVVWGVLYDDCPVGVCGIKHIQNSQGEYFGYLGEKSLWGKGIGAEMMRQAHTNALDHGIEQLSLTVLKENERAIRLYRKMGYILSWEDESFLHMTISLKKL